MTPTQGAETGLRKETAEAALERILFEWGVITDVSGIVRNLAAAGFHITRVVHKEPKPFNFEDAP